MKKEGSIENYDYSQIWAEEENQRINEEIKGFSKGKPRRGITGKYIKPVGYVSKKRIGISYAKGIEKLRNEEDFGRR